eukprot:XP_011662936.1 PREDICTED: BAG domain-containing protein Samui-like isoform X2 [Strongylocentrotus purpuratus]
MRILGSSTQQFLPVNDGSFANMYVQSAPHHSHQTPTSQQQYYWQNRPVNVEHGGSASPKNHHREFPIVDGKFVNQSMVSPQSNRRMGSATSMIQRPVTMHSPRQSRRGAPLQQSGSVLQRGGAVRSNARPMPPQQQHTSHAVPHLQQQQSNGRPNGSQTYTVPIHVQQQHDGSSSGSSSPELRSGMTNSMRNFNGHQTPISIPIQVLRGGGNQHSDFPHVPPPVPPYPHESLINQRAYQANHQVPSHTGAKQQPSPTVGSPQLPNVIVSGDLPQFTEDGLSSSSSPERQSQSQAPSRGAGQTRTAFRGAPRKAQSPPRTSPATQHKTTKTASSKTIDVNSKPASEKEDASSQHPKELREIFEIMTFIAKLGNEADSFNGSKSDPGYLKLEELLTRQVLRLDNIDAHGDASVRNERKKAVHKAQGYLDYLERKCSGRR